MIENVGPLRADRKAKPSTRTMATSGSLRVASRRGPPARRGRGDLLHLCANHICGQAPQFARGAGGGTQGGAKRLANR